MMKGVIIEVVIYSPLRLQCTEGESIRSISQSLGISRQTVKNTVRATPILMYAKHMKDLQQ